MSFHDLHQGSRAACAHFLDGLARLGIARISLLVVPRWHGGPSFTTDRVFTDWLRGLAAQGHDICLHGFFHNVSEVGGGPWQRLVGRYYTTCEGEYYRIDRATARDRVQRGLNMLVEEAGLPVVGFTPPAWLISEEGRGALVEAGLQYSTTFGSVDLLQSGRRLHAPTLVYSCRNVWRRNVSRAWVRFWAWVHATTPILRIAAHPCDFDHPAIEASLWACVRGALAKGRTAATYRDLVPNGVAPIPVRPSVAA